MFAPTTTTRPSIRICALAALTPFWWIAAALDLVKKTGDTLAVAGPAFSRQESGVALRKNNPELLAAIDQAIAEMQKDGTLAKISEKWFGADVTK